MSCTEKVILKVNRLCISATLYLSIENTFETASFKYSVGYYLLFVQQITLLS